MSSLKRIAALVLVLFHLCNKVAGDNPDKTVVYMGCNPRGFGGSTDESYYHNALEEIFHDLITQTPLPGYNRYCSFVVEDDNQMVLDFFYGHAACNGVITFSSCADCLIAAVGLIRKQCPSCLGVTLQLKDCRVRYETYEFTDP